MPFNFDLRIATTAVAAAAAAAAATVGQVGAETESNEGEFKVGGNEVVKGLDEGITRMSVGERAMITMTPSYVTPRHTEHSGHTEQQSINEPTIARPMD